MAVFDTAHCSMLLQGGALVQLWNPGTLQFSSINLPAMLCTLFAFEVMQDQSVDPQLTILTP